MRFTSFTSIAILMATAVSAVPSPTMTAVVRRDDELSNQARDVVPSETPDLIDIDIEANLLEARKPKWEKIDVDNKTGKNKGGKLKQNEWDEAKELAQKALYQANCKKGDVTNKWHIDGSQDPEEHITVEPSGGDGGDNGNIHVHRDGSWTQGPNGKNGKGDGKV